MRADIVAEQRRILAPPHAVVAALLLIRPAGGQIGERFDFVIHDRLVTQPRADHTEAFDAQAVDETRKPLVRDHRSRVVVHQAITFIDYADP